MMESLSVGFVLGCLLYEYSYIHIHLILSSQIISIHVVSLTDALLSMVKANTPNPVGTN